MAINYIYSPVVDGVTDANGAYVNHMQFGIEAACDGVDRLDGIFKNISTDSSYINTNSSFWAGGNYEIHLIDGKEISVSICGKTIKSSLDWFFQFADGYRPFSKFYFKYFLGATEYVGYVQTDGLMYFQTLNTTDNISCNFTFPIA